MSRIKFWGVLVVFLLSLLILVACGGPALPLRSDMGTDGLDKAVTYNLKGPAGTEQEVNVAELRGVNTVAPTLQLRTVFGKLSGSKTQDVQITLPNGQNAQTLGMIKTKRFAGLTRFMTVESATYSAVDNLGKAVCGAKIRLDFNRNLVQYTDPDRRDFQSLWYYDIPCSRDGTQFSLRFEDAKLRALVLNEIWQARIAWGSYFFNWGHSVTSIGGLPATWPGGWWLHMDVPNTNYDAMGTANLVNEMVKDLEASPQPWLEFKAGGPFATSATYLIYSAGDADKYATWDRVLLNRQTEYVVFYRLNNRTAWDYITVKPVYNFEFNDAGQVIANVKGWGKNPFSGRLNEQGLPKETNDSVIAEMERIGWMNAPNASLEQIQILSPEGRILYVMTVRAYIGAADSLVIFGRVRPDLTKIRQAVPTGGESLPKLVFYDERGNPLSANKQPYTDEQWAQFQREATIWNYLKDNPGAIGADLFVQYRFADNTQWAPIPCSDGSICGYKPIEWNLSTSYYMEGDPTKPWLLSQLLGEVGVRTLGMSYASGRFEGTGMLFALSQEVFRKEFYQGFQQESIWRLDARASQLPDTLTVAWKTLHTNN